MRSATAKHALVIKYSVTHEKHAREAIDKVSKIWPGDFNYFLFADADVDSDKLDAICFADSTELTGQLEGVLVHSRQQSGTFIEEEPVSFLTYIERAIQTEQ